MGNMVDRIFQDVASIRPTAPQPEERALPPHFLEPGFDPQRGKFKRHKRVKEFVEMARDSCPAAIRFIRELFEDASAAKRDRLEAAKLLLLYGMGKPREMAPEEQAAAQVAGGLTPEMAERLAMIGTQ